VSLCGDLFPKGWSIKSDIPCIRPEDHLGAHQTFMAGYYLSKPDMVSCFQWNCAGSSIIPIRDENYEYLGICVECDISVMGEKSLCSGCAHWLDLIERAADKRIVVDGAHYLVGPVGGFGGAKWIIEFLDPTREGFTTHQLWYQGIIPSHFRDRIPDNARFIKEKLKIPSSWIESEKDVQNGN
jgi:hypothetical protein